MSKITLPKNIAKNYGLTDVLAIDGKNDKQSNKINNYHNVIELTLNKFSKINIDVTVIDKKVSYWINTTLLLEKGLIIVELKIKSYKLLNLQ